MNERDWHPPNLYKDDGNVRRLGVEIELTGLRLATITDLIGRWAHAEPIMTTVAEGYVETRWGKLKTEIDWLYLRKLSDEHKISQQSQVWLELLRDIATVVVPAEIVFPPIPMNELHELESLIEQLREAGAKGTAHSPLAAFGVHLNPELPNLKPETISAYICAFGLLQWWLVEVSDIDFTRRVVPYIDLYPEAYVLRTLTYDRETSLAQLQQDYLHHNPTRNRALDLWPLFAFLDEQWVRENTDDEHIKARPTLHYRLPNCDIDKPGWQLHDTWPSWNTVEKLANAPQLLQQLSLKFQQEQRPLLGANRSQWVEYLTAWLKDHLLV